MGSSRSRGREGCCEDRAGARLDIAPLDLGKPLLLREQLVEPTLKPEQGTEAVRIIDNCTREIQARDVLELLHRLYGSDPACRAAPLPFGCGVPTVQHSRARLRFLIRRFLAPPARAAYPQLMGEPLEPDSTRGYASLIEVDSDDTVSRRQLDLVVRSSLPHVAFWLGVLYLLLSAAHFLTLPRAVQAVLVPVALCTAILFFAYRIAAVRWLVPLRLVHPLTAAMFALVLANGLLELRLTGEVTESTNVMLTMVGAAVIFASTPWFAVVLIASLGGWVAAVWGISPIALELRLAVGMLTAAAVAVISHGVRMHTLRRVELDLIQELRREEEMNRIFALSQDMQCIFEVDGRLARTNPAYERVVGRGSDELRGMSAADFVHPEDRGGVARALAELQAGAAHVAVESRLLGADGGVRWVLWDAVPLPGGRLVYASGRDITVRKRMEEQLRLNSVALESAANAVVVTDRAGAITWVNPAFERLTGYSSAEALGQNPRLLRSGKHEASFYEELWRTIAAGLVWHGETVNRRKDGSLYTEEQTIAPVRDLSGEITHFVAVKDDVTERRRAELILREHVRLMQREMDLAAEVQAGLLPTSLPILAGFEVAADARPARFVSGDLYDWLPLGDEACLFVMADISGKGVSAAMLSAAARTLVRSIGASGARPGKLLEELNRALYEELSRVGMFVTFFALHLDSRRGTACYANAGHTQALVARPGKAVCERLGATGLPLGVVAGAEVEERQIAIEPGDTLLIYSDGVTEAANSRDDLYGMEALCRTFTKGAGGSARETIEGIVREVNAFCDGEAPSDDLTLLAVHALDRTYAFRCRATTGEIESALKLVREASLRYGERFAYESELVASELLTNIAVHAYHGEGGEIRGEVTALAGGIRISTWDDGAPFDPEAVPAADLSSPHEGRYGLHIVRELSTEVSRREDEGSNHWSILRLRGPEPGGRGGALDV